MKLLSKEITIDLYRTFLLLDPDGAPRSKLLEPWILSSMQAPSRDLVT
jgi:hypothetical protein